MRRLLLFATIILFAAGTSLYSQTLVQPGDGTLSQAIADAQSGDVLQLIPGSEYTESTLFTLAEIHKKITIEIADPTSTSLPVVSISSNDGTSTPNFFTIGDSGSITLKGIEFDGTQNGTPTVSHLVQVIVGTTTDSGFVHKIDVEDCFVHDLAGNVIDAGSSNLSGVMVVDTIIVNNCIFHNTFTSVYMKYAGTDYIQVTNSTFYEINSYGVRVGGPSYTKWYDHTPTALIDHTTWYNIGISDPREVILLEKGPNLNPWTVANTIISDQTAGSHVPINIKELVDTSMQHDSSICLWQVNKVNWRGGVVVDTITMDPQFANPDSGDFTLPKGSKLLTFGTDGGPIGDPRWATNAPTAVISNNSNKPVSFGLAQNYPNPFNPTTQIKFSLQKAGVTSLVVYNLLGQEVATLIQGNLTAGEHSVNFNATNLSSGVYIYRLNSSNRTIAKKMILIK